jgi:hypothetical protein
VGLSSIIIVSKEPFYPEIKDGMSVHLMFKPKISELEDSVQHYM